MRERRPSTASEGGKRSRKREASSLCVCACARRTELQSAAGFWPQQSVPFLFFFFFFFFWKFISENCERLHLCWTFFSCHRPVLQKQQPDTHTHTYIERKREEIKQKIPFFHTSQRNKEEEEEEVFGEITKRKPRAVSSSSSFCVCVFRGGHARAHTQRSCSSPTGAPAVAGS